MGSKGRTRSRYLMRYFLGSALGSLLVMCVLPVAAQQSGSSPHLSADEVQGKKLFLQRCSICHMPSTRVFHYPDLPTYGPKLEGYIQNPAMEQRARAAIHDGTPRMPGFRYGLTGGEIDQLIAYLKVFRISDFVRMGVEIGDGPDVEVPVNTSGGAPAEAAAD